MLENLETRKQKKGKDTPANYEICESCKTHLDAEEEIPIHLLVKLLKWKLLWIKSNDLKRRDAEKKAAIEKEKGASKKEKGKDAGKSAKGKGKKTPEPPSPKKESKLRKRGDEDLSSKYLDDEPDDGPQHYVLIYGFHLPYIFQLLDEISIPVECIIRVSTQDYTKLREPQPADVQDEPTPTIDEEAVQKLQEQRAKLKKFWHDFNIIIEKAPRASKVHDLARLNYVVQTIMLPLDPADQEKKLEFVAALFEDVACLCYDLIDSKRQHGNYLANMKLLPIPLSGLTPSAQLDTSADAAPAIVDTPDMRYYNDLMNTIPQESVSVELIMFCMMEQIDAIELEKTPPSQVQPPLGANGVDYRVAGFLDSLASSLALTGEEVLALGPEFSSAAKAEDSPKEPKLLSSHDDIAMRVEHLKELRGLNAKRAEQEMLRHVPFAGMNCFSRPSSRVAQERAARLQELLHFCTNTGLAQSEIDRALKQFVFECIDLTGTDPNGYILAQVGEGAHHSIMPWDDPYPYFKIPLSSSGSGSCSQNSSAPSEQGESRDGAKSPTPGTGEPAQESSQRPATPGILRTISKQSSTHSAVRFGTDHEGQEIPPLEKSPEPEKSIEESVDEIIHSQKRNLDQWCFAEHFDSNVLLQVLRKAMYTLPFYDTYYHKRDHSLMVVLHNPYNSENENCNFWESNLHSAVGFRNYLEHVAESIEGWTRTEEAKYQADILRNEVNKIDTELKSSSRDASSDKARSRSKSPKKASTRGRSTPRSASRERVDTPITKDFVRDNSLKAQKVQMDKMKAEEEEKERLKTEKRARSASKKAPKESENEKTTDKDKKRPGSKGSKLGSRKSSPTPKEEPVAVEEPAKEQEKYWPFIGYDLGYELIHASGRQHCLFPCDGGFICAERIDFVLGSCIVKTTVIKDGHVFSIHIKDPLVEKDTKETEGGTNIKVSQEANKVQNEPAVEEVFHEKGETETTEKGEIDTNEKGEAEDKEKEEENKGEQTVATEVPKRSVSKYGSFTATLRDGLVVSYSSFGERGEAEIESDDVEPPPQPVATGSVRTPTPGKESPSKTKRDKSQDKSAAAITPEIPRDVEQCEVQEEKYRRPFQKLYLTSPDGLQVQFVSERDCGVASDSDVLVVRQSYPQKTANIQKCEEARKFPAMQEASRLITKEGNVIKNMADGTIEVLFADGTFTKMSASPIQLTAASSVSVVTAVATSTSASMKTIDSPPKRSPKPRKGSPNQEKITTAEEEKKPQGLWQTTLPMGKKISTTMDGITEVPVRDEVVCTAHDAATGEVMFTREDRVVIVQRPDGTTLVDHSDGTRITRYIHETETFIDANEGADADDSDPAACSEKIVLIECIVRVECPGFATVEFNEQSGLCDVRMGKSSSSLIHAYPDASYIIDMWDGGRLNIDSEGAAAYFPKPNNDIVYHASNQELTYFFRHDTDSLVETLDNEGNIFTVTASGDVSVCSGGRDGANSISSFYDTMGDCTHVERKIIQCYGQHAPRFFLIHADGSGTELLRYQDVADYLALAEADKDTAVLIDSLADFPNVTGINVLRPAELGLSQRWLKEYDEPCIIPVGLCSRDLKTLPPDEVLKKEREADQQRAPFGTDVGKGLTIGMTKISNSPAKGPKCPAVLEHRQLVQFKPVTDDVRETMYNCLRDYARFVKARTEDSHGLLLIEPRSEEESMHATDLVLQSMPTKSETALDLSNGSICDVYERATAPPLTISSSIVLPKRTTADWDQSRNEVEMALQNRKALREKNVPPYFDHIGKSLLLIQAPDMDALMNELAQDPRRTSCDSLQEDPHDQKCSAISLAVDANDVSPSQSEVRDALSKHSYGEPAPEYVTSNISSELLLPTEQTSEHSKLSTQSLSRLSVGPERPPNPTPLTASEVKKRDGLTQTSDSTLISDKIVEESPTEIRLNTPPGEEKQNVKALYQNVIGEQRTKPVWVPAYLKASRPNVVVNHRFMATEDPCRRKVMTSSVAAATENGNLLLQNARGFELLPDRVDFGILREGHRYRFPVCLKNIGVDSCRFKLQQPPLATGLSICYKPGPVAAGMKAMLMIDLFAVAVGVEHGATGEAGDIAHDLKITTETHLLTLPIRASVLVAEDYDNLSKSKPLLTLPGVQELSNRPTPAPTHGGIIRPKKRDPREDTADNRTLVAEFV